MMAVWVQDLHKSFGDVHALRGIRFSVPQGQRFGIVGADGAGKSTCLRILASLESADSGHVQVLGLDPHKESKILRSKLGWMPQKFSLYGDLSVWENLDFYGQIYGLAKQRRKERAFELLRFVHLDEFSGRRASKLSGGMKQKLALACALLHQPELLILDEPTVGVDPVSRQDFRLLLDELRSKGLSVLMSTPYMDEGEACDQVALFHEGQILALGKPAELGQGLPSQLWELQFAQSKHYSMTEHAPAPFNFIYPGGGQLRGFSALGLDPSLVRSSAQNAFPDLIDCIPIACGLEDLLIWHLRIPQ